jgi:hypothetical protein
MITGLRARAMPDLRVDRRALIGGVARRTIRIATGRTNGSSRRRTCMVA